MYKWNDSYLEKMYYRIKEWAKKDYQGKYNFTDEELEKPNLNSKIFRTKSPKIWRMLTLAFLLGQMSGIKRADEGKTPIVQHDSETNLTTK